MSEFEDRVRRDLHRSAEAVEPPPLLWRRVEDRLGGRDRRPMAVLAAAAAVVVAVAVLAVALHSGGSEKHVASVSPETTEPQGVVVPAEQTTTTASATTAPALPPSASPSTTRATTKTVAAPTTTTSPPDCTAADLAYYTTTDRSSYPPGVSVTISVGARNISNHTCRYYDGICQSARILPDSGGPAIWFSGGEHPVCNTLLRMGPLDPGQTRGAVISWDRRTCTAPSTTTSVPTYGAPCDGPPAGPGTYRAEGHANPDQNQGQYEGSGVAVSAPFQLE